MTTARHKIENMVYIDYEQTAAAARPSLYVMQTREFFTTLFNAKTSLNYTLSYFFHYDDCGMPNNRFDRVV
jgi:hypothetical protein